MEWQAWVTVATIVTMSLLLASEKGPPDLVMLSSVTFLWSLGIVSNSAYLAGFSSTGLMTIGALFVVVKGVDASGFVDRSFRWILGQRSDMRLARARICFVMFFLSGIFNNTPLIAMAIPIVRDWARSRGIAPCRLLMPIDYACVMGGLLTTIGTSTNMQANDFMLRHGEESFSFLEPAYVALPVGLVVLSTMLFICDYFLPTDRGGLFRELQAHGTKMVTALKLPSDSKFDGKQVADVLMECKVPVSCLIKVRRPLPNSSTILVPPQEIGTSPDSCSMTSPTMVVLETPEEATRTHTDTSSQKLDLEANIHPVLLQDAGMHEIFPVPAHEIAKAGDIILLSMSSEEVVDILGQRELTMGHNVHVSSIHAAQLVGPGSEFVEVVLGTASPVIGQPISQGASVFESKYKVCLVATRLRGEVGRKEEADPDAEMDTFARQTSMSLMEPHTSKPPSRCFIPGDTVMVLAQRDMQLPSSDFLLVTRVGAIRPRVRPYDYLPLVLFLAGMVVVIAGVFSMLLVSMVLLIVVIAGGWVKASKCDELIHWRLLVLIGAANGISEALESSGLSGHIASLLLNSGLPNGLVLPVVFVSMVCMTEIVTNNAACSLGLPVAAALAKQMQLESPRPLAMAVMLGASTGYAMPTGYQTHLMVMAPGGYTVCDFLKFGALVDIFYAVGACVVLPLIFPLS
eukprot:TRINITY_DN92948_c0_g1_i1.p1 TRINITY_DN92948_c0_g1~~TRINITY_DN92948_c0_g1_i1.p1  ORF type:complete len:686 (-),score=106.95 TRINITY_DN92948_c0_g1_i1:191-2248(-)